MVKQPVGEQLVEEELVEEGLLEGWPVEEVLVKG